MKFEINNLQKYTYRLLIAYNETIYKIPFTPHFIFTLHRNISLAFNWKIVVLRNKANDKICAKSFEALSNLCRY